MLFAFASFAGALSSLMMQYVEVPFSKVQVHDSFWSPIQKTNTEVTIAHSLNMLEKFGYLENFDLAAAGKREGFRGLIFMDSDAYKVLEAASYSLAVRPDKSLSSRLDAIIKKLADAQMEDGYLNTYFQIKEPEKRFTNLRDAHEIYCFGHLAEAAVAHYQATGKTNLLDVAKKFADLLVKVFGREPGQREGYCGHPEAELALMKLARATGNESYRALAGFFLKSRGSKFFAKEHHTPVDRYDGSYWQDDVPISEHSTMKGHAVRCAYLLSGAADYVGATGDSAMRAMLDRVWRNCMDRNVYITGGIGPSAHNEGFTTDYDLPNETAYQETCASIAIVFWAHRMNLLTGDSEYADAMERALYNGALAGVSASGDRFFYVNPLASQGGHHRTEWFACACCPPNISRLIASIGSYAYAEKRNSLLVNLFMGGEVATEQFSMKCKTAYPWDGACNYTIVKAPSETFEIKLRLPNWCRDAKISVNGRRQTVTAGKDGYYSLSRKWIRGDTITYDLELVPQWMQSDPAVKQNLGMVALTRGPLVYCFEQCDNSTPLSEIAIDLSSKLVIDRKSHVITGGGLVANGSYRLYAPRLATMDVSVRAVPYYSWDNREPGPMRVWMPLQIPKPFVRGLEASAVITMSHVSSNCDPKGAADGLEPASSGETPAANCHWWPRKGTADDWLQYSWDRPVSVSRARIYWFDDTGHGECRLPKSYRLLYRRNAIWQPVKLWSNAFEVAKDKWIELSFDPVETDAMRIEVEMQPGWSAGVLEWQVFSH